MGNIQGRFSDQNDIITTGIVQTANNNQNALNNALAETDHLRSTSAIFQPTGLLATPANLVPNVTSTLSGTIGAALSGQGQAGTPSEQPGGGGNPPCFIGQTVITTPDGGQIFIHDIKLDDRPWILAFDPMTGERGPKPVIATMQHLVNEYLLLEFADGHTTGVDVNGLHRYWIGHGEFESVDKLGQVLHWQDEWAPRMIVKKTVVNEPTILYNLTVADFHDYIANGDAVSNLCPTPDDPIFS